MASQKALEMSIQLADKISKRVAGTMPVLTTGFDSLNNPTFTVSADSVPATTEKVIVVTCKTYETGTAKDVFGNTATAFTPTVVQICTELPYHGTTDNVADYLTPADLLPVLGECLLTGCMVEWHQTANGTVPSAAAIVAGTNLAASFKASQYWGIQSAS